VVAAYLLATIVMTLPYMNYARFADAMYVGDQQLIIWTLAWDNHALLTGTPLFDSNIFFPARQSLRYNEHLFGVSLFTLPWTAAGASPVLAHNITWYLAFLLNGLASFALLCRFVKRRSAAFIGSLAFTFSYYVMLHAHAHLHLIWLWPLPLSVWLLERWFDTRSWWSLARWLAVLLVALLTSWYVAAMAILTNAIALLALLLAPGDETGSPPRSRFWRPRLLQLATAGVVALACVYPFARHYTGLRSSPGEAAFYSADVASYVVPPENTLAGRWWLGAIDERPRSTFGEQTLFAGWLALALAAAGMLSLLRQGAPRRAWLFPALLVAAFLLSLGPAPGFNPALAPFNWLAALPGGAGMRAPARFAAVVMLGVAGLAAIGADRLMSRLRKPQLLGAMLAPVMLAEYFVVGFPAGPPMPQPVPAIYLTPEVQAARSLVSLPEYQGTDEWFRGGNYLYYSTRHWRPVVNGFGRAEPPGHAETVQSLRGFPDGGGRLRELGVQYVVVHGEQFPNHGEQVIAAARAMPDYRLVTNIGADYLFEVLNPQPGR
jgi:hypothetical protein